MRLDIKYKLIFNKKKDYFENKLSECMGKPKELKSRFA